MTIRFRNFAIVGILLYVGLNTLMAKTYYISSLKGKMNGNGSIKKPLKKISQGAELASAGDTVYVMEGIYRERVAPAKGGSESAPVVYMAEPDKNVIIKGSEVWSPKWQKLKNNIYFAVPNESMFNDVDYVDSKNPFKVMSSSTPYGREGKAEVMHKYKGDTTIVYTCGQVFVDAEILLQKPFLAEMTEEPNSWFYDKKSGAIYIHFGDDKPSNHTVEITTRRRIFSPHKRGLGYITVQGFVMEHCGNNYPAYFWRKACPQWQQAGALSTRSGHHWTITNNIIRFANSIGIDFGNEGNEAADIEIGNNGQAIGAGFHVIDANYIIDNGAAGTAAYYPTNITFTHNVVERNNNLKYVGAMRWESAGVKMHAPHNSIISNNLIRNNYGDWGLWLDQGSGMNTVVSNNLIVGNGRGFDMEIGNPVKPDKLMFINNVLINNKYGIYCRESGGITAMNNLIIGSTKTAIENTIAKKRTEDWQGEHLYFYNNILLKNKFNMRICPPDYFRSADRKFDCNLYDIKSGDKTFAIIENGDSLTLSEWQNKWTAYNSGENCDLSSNTFSDFKCQYNNRNLSLKISVGESFFLAKTKNHKKLKSDYFNNQIKSDTKLLCGPFQQLKQGESEIVLWNGLKPIDEYELRFRWTKSQKTGSK